MTVSEVMTAPRRIRTSQVTVRMIEPGIMEALVHDGAHIDEEDIRAIQEVNVELSEGRPYTVLVSPGRNTTVTDAAKALASDADFTKNTLAKAMLVRSAAHRILGRIFVKANKTALPTRTFSNREKAIEWLRGFVEKERITSSKE